MIDLRSGFTRKEDPSSYTERFSGRRSEIIILAHCLCADVYFEHLLVGQQVNDNNNSNYDEFRYWDNVTFSTARVP
jgi:hypothetical protein